MLAVHLVDVAPSELRFHRTSGRLCLDLVATIGERWRRRFERLRGPGDVDRWLAEAGMTPATPAVDEDVRMFRRLRGAVELMAVAALEAADVDPDWEAVVNRFAAQPPPVPQLSAAAMLLHVPSVSAAASAVARDAIDLFSGPLTARIRECAADDCALLFLDTSRPGTRRWCSMRACGNRAKAARHRARTADLPGRR